MIIYTNLPVKEVLNKANEYILKDNQIYILMLIKICDRYNIDLKQGVQEIPVSDKQPKKVLFWFAKSNAKSLTYYRVCEALESIYQGLVKLENHKELIK